MMTATSDTRACPLRSIALLLEALEEHGIGYCHWKSNDVLDRSARGENDLDLLVDRRDGSRFLGILHELGFKQVTANPDKRLPGVLDFYGYDFEADRFVHVHLHFQLVVGHDATKNFCIPLERVYLSSVTRSHGFRIPRPEAELVLYVVRLMLKHATWDAVLVLQGRLTKAERRELTYLRERADPDGTRTLVERELPFVGVGLFMACLAVLDRPGTSLRRMRLGGELRRALRAHSRRGPWTDAALKLLRRGALGIRRKLLRRGRPKPRPSSGGLLVAVVGGDGAGKSTVVDALTEWLARELDVRRVHLGKPPRSISTRLIQMARSGARVLLDALGRNGGSTEELTPTADGSMKRRARLSRLIWDVSVGRDRLRAFAAARRFAMNGGIVISDRFPLPGVLRSMDAPQVREAVPKEGRSRFVAWLARLEEGWYRSMVPPDLVVMLRVDPDVAVRRKADEDSAYVRMRSEEVWNADLGATPAVLVVDASRPVDQVLSEVKELVWTRI